MAESFERLKAIWENQSSPIIKPPSPDQSPTFSPNQLNKSPSQSRDPPPRPPISTKPSKNNQLNTSTDSLSSLSNNSQPKQRRPAPLPPINNNRKVAPSIPPKHTKASRSSENLKYPTSSNMASTSSAPPLPNRNRSAPQLTTNNLNEIEEYSSDDNSSTNENDDLDELNITNGPQSKRAPAILPDISQANRRNPKLSTLHSVSSKSQFYSVATSNNLVVTGSHHIRIYDSSNSNASDVPFYETSDKDTKITALKFKNSTDSLFWAATKDGTLFEMDAIDGRSIDWQMHDHPSTIIEIWTLNNHMITLDDTGVLKVWLPVTHANGKSSPTLNSPTKMFKVNPNISFANFLGDKLWIASSASLSTNDNSNSLNGRSISIRVYDPLSAAYGGTFNLTPSALTPTSNVQQLAVTSGTVIPSMSHNIYLGHQGGYVSVWSSEDFNFLGSVKVSSNQVDSLAGVGGYLWAGFHSGKINVFDTNNGAMSDWRVVQTWQAHKEKVMSIQVDTKLLSNGQLGVVTSGADWNVNYWDGMLKSSHLCKLYIFLFIIKG